jgi:hypothetical protein
LTGIVLVLFFWRMLSLGLGRLSTVVLLLAGVLIFHLVYTFKKDTVVHKVVIPGLICGVVMSVDSGLFVLLLVPGLMILFFPGTTNHETTFCPEANEINSVTSVASVAKYTARKLAKLFGLAGTAAATYVLMIPLSFYLFVPFHSVPGFESGPGVFYSTSYADNRDVAAAWMKQNLEAGTYLAVPQELNMDIDSLQKDFRIVPIDFAHLQPHSFMMLSATDKELYILFPTWAQYSKDVRIKERLDTWNGFRAMCKEAVLFKGNSVIPDYYFPVTPKNPAISIRRIGSARPVPEVFHMWHRVKKDTANTSPSIHLMGARGKFKLEFKKQEGRNILAVSNLEPGKKGQRLCQLGFTANKNGFLLPIPQDRYVHLLVEARIPDHLAGKDNYLFIQDFNGTWEREKYYFPYGGWLTCFVSKRVRRGSSRLNLGIMFTPGSKKDKLMIGDAYICVSN